MMNQVFLILAYKKPQQLALLINQLQDPGARFFIHVDKKSDIQPFLQGLKDCPNVHFSSKRHRVRWGTYGILSPTLTLIGDLSRAKLTYSHAHLLSGEDICIKPFREIQAFFSANADKSFMEYFPLPSGNWRSGGLQRVLKYHLPYDRRNAGRIWRLVFPKMETMINDVVVPLFPFLRKEVPGNLLLYGGSAWWSFNREGIERINQGFETERSFLKTMKTSFCPDEIFFHTMLMNSELASSVCNSTKRVIGWSRSKHVAPDWLTLDDFSRLKNSDCFFARKVDFEKGKNLYRMFS